MGYQPIATGIAGCVTLLYVLFIVQHWAGAITVHPLLPILTISQRKHEIIQLL